MAKIARVASAIAKLAAFPPEPPGPIESVAGKHNRDPAGITADIGRSYACDKAGDGSTEPGYTPSGPDL